MTSLRQRMIDDLRVRNYAPGTIGLYIRSVASFAQHFGKSPDKLGLEHIREYQTYLVNTKKVSWPIFNQAVCALRFFYKFTLDKPWMIEHIPFPKQEKKLPVVLSPEEIATFFQAVGNLKHRTVLMTIYGSGVRREPGPTHRDRSARWRACRRAVRVTCRLVFPRPRHPIPRQEPRARSR
jgi:integrase/recombinase XerD